MPRFIGFEKMLRKLDSRGGDYEQFVFLHVTSCDLCSVTHIFRRFRKTSFI